MVESAGHVLGVNGVDWFGHVKNFRLPGVLPS
jgi:hypothetical protein